jgi:tryptophanyl-tRNA synthetase
MIADVQALSDNFDNPQKIKKNVIEVFKDYIATGIDPQKCTILIQSLVPELFELTTYYMNLISVTRLERNPTIKNELQHKSFANSITAGFLSYPISQAADITAFKATHIPVGDDQIALIEVSNEIVRRFNRVYNTDILVESEVILGKTSRLIGIDGVAKASKSLNNAIFLSDSPEVVKQKVYSMYTDPNHIKVSDQGRVEGNVVFAYLDAFLNDEDELASLKSQYRRGGLGDSVLKSLLNEILQSLLAPIAEKRATIIEETILETLVHGSEVARGVAATTLRAVRDVIGITYN